MLKNHRVEVVENPKIHQKFAVIDRECIVRTEESIMRLESKGIAEELVSFFYRK
jgi:hypothetical protein